MIGLSGQWRSTPTLSAVEWLPAGRREIVPSASYPISATSVSDPQAVIEENGKQPFANRTEKCKAVIHNQQSLSVQKVHGKSPERSTGPFPSSLSGLSSTDGAIS
ncbi:MAG: hypothetical protein WBP37_12525 [Candidatus Dechloromonas phosphoritropha]